MLDVVDDKKVEDEVEPKKFVKAKVGDTIKIVKYDDFHSPKTHIGDVHIVTRVCGSWVDTNKSNSFDDTLGEYEIIDSLPKQLCDYATDEILEEIRLRSVK